MTRSPNLNYWLLPGAKSDERPSTGDTVVDVGGTVVDVPLTPQTLQITPEMQMIARAVNKTKSAMKSVVDYAKSIIDSSKGHRMEHQTSFVIALDDDPSTVRLPLALEGLIADFAASFTPEMLNVIGENITDLVRSIRKDVLPILEEWRAVESVRKSVVVPKAAPEVIRRIEQILAFAKAE